MQRFIKRLMLSSLLIVGLLLSLAPMGRPLTTHPAPASIPDRELTMAQVFTTQSGIMRFYDLWQVVYERLPDFPMENQYIDRETGDTATTNTLAGRLMRYHLLVKGRPPTQRLDWKLTLADYLGANEPVLTYQYPGHDTLTENPIQGDLAAIGRLNRQERDRLVEVLVSVFTGSNSGGASPANTSPTNPSGVSATDAPPVESAPTPIEVGPGAAQLLLR